jgi:hypothetical protein
LALGGGPLEVGVIDGIRRRGEQPAVIGPEKQARLARSTPSRTSGGSEASPVQSMHSPGTWAVSM